MLIATFSCILSDLTQSEKNVKISYEVIIMYSNWYVIQVQPKSEYRLCTKIKDRVSKDLYRDCFVPQAEYLYKKDGVFEKRIRPLFPGYIFVSTDNVKNFYDSLKKIDGFKRILKSGEDFTPISSEEAGFISGITDDEYNISLSAGFIIDSKITITSGPLVGNEGIIKKIDRHKRIGLIEINFMGQPQLVKMPLEIISKS